MANESTSFEAFIAAVTEILDLLRGGHVFLVVDRVSTDDTRLFCEKLERRDARYQLVWAPENRNVVDAYLRGFRAALNAGFDNVVEMDAGLSHDPAAIPVFLEALARYECVFGSRTIQGGSISQTSSQRRALSAVGTWLARLLLGARLSDMTSGFQAFRRSVLEDLVAYPLRSRAHFYQTEVRFLLRHRRIVEVPIHYRAASPRVSSKAIWNALQVLLYYLALRIVRRSPAI